MTQATPSEKRFNNRRAFFRAFVPGLFGSGPTILIMLINMNGIAEIDMSGWTMLIVLGISWLGLMLPLWGRKVLVRIAGEDFYVHYKKGRRENLFVTSSNGQKITYQQFKQLHDHGSFLLYSILGLVCGLFLPVVIAAVNIALLIYNL